ncbi:AEC family transporter [Ammoniphilus oxalaticus]|nr:AEC family transporter [Ammoniphilus oxalaticus]
MWLLFQELSILYAICLIGFIAKRAKLLTQHADQVLTQLILSITLPALIVYAMNFSFGGDDWLAFGQLIFLSAYALGIAIMLAWLLNRLTSIEQEKLGIYQSLIIFGNQGFIGFALCYILFAEIGIAYAAVFNLIYLILIWTYCPYLIGRNKTTFTWKHMLFNPGIIATFVGFVCCLLPAPLPTPLLSLLEQIGKMTIPLSMLLIGGLLANLAWKELGRYARDKWIWTASFAKLIVIPLCLFPMLLLPFPFTVIAIATLITASPSAPTTSLFAQKYSGDIYFASAGVFLSTALAGITIPLIYLLLLWLR